MDIPSLIIDLWHQFGSIDIAESEFSRLMNEDEKIMTAFKEWCNEMGYKERKAFVEYCQEYIDENEKVFDSLSDYNE